MLAPSPPYALASTAFRFAALASLAGRAPLGGKREVALAVYVAARLAHDALPERAVSESVRGERASGAKHWMSMLALPSAPVRANLTRLIDASVGTPDGASKALAAVIAVTGVYLDASARTELEQLARALAQAESGTPSQPLVE